jgi:hypothetical protein
MVADDWAAITAVPGRVRITATKRIAEIIFIFMIKLLNKVYLSIVKLLLSGGDFSSSLL